MAKKAKKAPAAKKAKKAPAAKKEKKEKAPRKATPVLAVLSNIEILKLQGVKTSPALNDDDRAAIDKFIAKRKLKETEQAELAALIEKAGPTAAERDTLLNPKKPRIRRDHKIEALASSLDQADLASEAKKLRAEDKFYDKDGNPLKAKYPRTRQHHKDPKHFEKTVNIGGTDVPVNTGANSSAFITEQHKRVLKSQAGHPEINYKSRNSKPEQPKK